MSKYTKAQYAKRVNEKFDIMGTAIVPDMPDDADIVDIYFELCTSQEALDTAIEANLFSLAGSGFMNKRRLTTLEALAGMLSEGTNIAVKEAASKFLKEARG